MHLDFVCCLHRKEDSTTIDKVIPFNKKTLVNCKKILEARKEQKLKYVNVSLPEDTESCKGYHLPCYRRFIALSKLQRNKMASKTSSNKKVVNLNDFSRWKS